VTQEWQDKRQHLLDSTMVQEITLSVLQDLVQQAHEFAAERDCSEDEAFRLILGYGLAYLRGEASLRRIERADTPDKALAEAQESTRQMMEEATHAAALKFQAYRLAEDNQVLEMRNNAMTNELLMARNRMSIFREDEDRLKARIRDLEVENQRLRAMLPESGEIAIPQTKPRWLFGLLKR
jgi:hypothetical protein